VRKRENKSSYEYLQLGKDKVIVIIIVFVAGIIVIARDTNAK
jgi:hypothetical protein